MSKVDIDLSDSESSMDSVGVSVGVGKTDENVVDASDVEKDARALPTYITIETTDGQLEHVKVGLTIFEAYLRLNFRQVSTYRSSLNLEMAALASDGSRD